MWQATQSGTENCSFTDTQAVPSSRPDVSSRAGSVCEWCLT